MSSSYFITFGGNRVTLAGTPGPIAWEDPGVLVLMDPYRESNLDYLKMRFVTPDGEEIILEDGDGNTASASAYVPTNSTAYWTGHGYEGNASAKYFVSALNCAGFDSVSADTAVTTAVIESPYATAQGSALLTATRTASARAATWTARLVTYGQNSTVYPVSLSATSFLGTYSTPMDTSLHTAWLPHGSEVRWSASASAGWTFSIVPEASRLSGFTIGWSHRDSGSKMNVTGYVVSATPLKLGSGRAKNVYATGYNHVIPTSALNSAATWQPQAIITSFSSNLCTGSAAGGYLDGSANVSKVYGFPTATNTLGGWKNSAGTWGALTSSTDTYKWANRYFISNSAYASGTFSAIRHKGGTGNNNSTYAFYGKNTNGSSVVHKSAQYAVPTASGKTSTFTASYASSNSVVNSEIFTVLSVGVAQSTALCCNCVGHWTASGNVV